MNRRASISLPAVASGATAPLFAKLPAATGHPTPRHPDLVTRRRVGCWTARLAAAALVAGGCASSLSTMQPATVVPKHQIHAVAALDVSIPVSAAATLISEGEDIAMKELQGGSLTTADRDRLIDASVALMLNAPSIGQELQIGYGLFDRTEVDLRYALSALRLGFRYQFLGPLGTSGKASHGFVGTVGLGASHYAEAIPVPDVLDKVIDAKDFVRNEVDVPLQFGWSSDLFHVWFGPKLVYSRFGSSLSVCTGIDTQTKMCTTRAGARVHGSALFTAGQVGAAIGWKHVWFAAELTVAYLVASADGTVTDGNTTIDRHFAPSDLVVYPAFGLLGRF